jgi:phosphoenolpyruvate phosphomutase
MRFEVVVPMCADFCHVGHVRLLERAASLGGLVTVLLMTDEAMMTYRRRPFFTFSERRETLLALRSVHNVFPFAQHPDKFEDFVREHKPRYFVHGTDWRVGTQAKSRALVIQAMAEHGGTVVEPEYTRGISSSMIHALLTGPREEAHADGCPCRQA